MKTLLILVGKTADSNIKTLVENYISRIGHYVPFETKIVPEPKNTASLTREKQCKAEGNGIKKFLLGDDWIILLDEHGKEYTSMEFSDKLKRMWQNSSKRLVFVIGGPYGFSPEIKSLAKETMSLSRMTFSHQMVRLIFAEQFYRALTIIKGEPYHHE